MQQNPFSHRMDFFMDQSAKPLASLVEFSTGEATQGEFL